MDPNIYSHFRRRHSVERDAFRTMPLLTITSVIPPALTGRSHHTLEGVRHFC